MGDIFKRYLRMQITQKADSKKKLLNDFAHRAKI